MMSILLGEILTQALSPNMYVLNTLITDKGVENHNLL